MALKPIQITGLTGGVNRASAPWRLGSGQLVHLTNGAVRAGLLVNRPGYAGLTNFALAGGTPFHGGYWYQNALDGSDAAFWAAAGAKLYAKTTLVGTWTERTGTAAPQAGADQVVHFTEQRSLADYKNYLIVSQNHTNPATALNGTAGGAESLVWYSASPTSNLEPLPGGAGYNHSNTGHRCKQAISFADHILLLNTYEETAASTWRNMSSRIRWSTAGAFTDAPHWDSVATTGAGYQDLDGAGGILRGDYLGSMLAVYQPRSIWALYHTQSAANPYEAVPKIAGTGLLGPRYLVGVHDAHYLLTSDGRVCRYSGGRDLEDIGAPLGAELFESLSTVVTGGYRIADRGYAGYLPCEKILFFAVPTAANTGPDTWYCLDLARGVWLDKWRPATPLTGMGCWPWPGVAGLTTQALFGDAAATNCSVYGWGGPAVQDGSAEIVMTAVLPDFGGDLRSQTETPAIYLQARAASSNATTVAIDVSTDGGVNWSTVQVQTLTTSWANYRYNQAVPPAGDLVRLRLRTSGGPVELAQVQVGLGTTTRWE